MSGTAVLLAATGAAATEPTWWQAVLDSPLLGVVIGFGASAIGAWWVRRHADRTARAAAETEVQARYRLQARRLLTAVAGLQEVTRGGPIVEFTRDGTIPHEDRRRRALAALRKVEARHWDMVLDCPTELKDPADDLVAATRSLQETYDSGQLESVNAPPSTGLVEHRVVSFGRACRAYFAGEPQPAKPPVQSIPMRPMEDPIQ